MAVNAMQDILNETVMDCFFGAGKTGLVALKHNRKFIEIELNPECVNIDKINKT